MIEKLRELLADRTTVVTIGDGIEIELHSPDSQDAWEARIALSQTADTPDRLLAGFSRALEACRPTCGGEPLPAGSAGTLIVRTGGEASPLAIEALVQIGMGDMAMRLAGPGEVPDEAPFGSRLPAD